MRSAAHGFGPPDLVLSLAEAGLVRHNVTKVKLEDINENLEALGRGDIFGRQVIVFE
jgi:propanol-preferring alcohol dehydrogenase